MIIINYISDITSRMETFKSEEYYYLKVCPLSSSKTSSTLADSLEYGSHVEFQHPAYLNVIPMVRQNKQSHLFQESSINVPQFYQISFKKPLTYAELQSSLMMSLSKPQGLNKKPENAFKIRLMDLMKQSRNKENFYDKHILASVDSKRKMELIIIPSFNQLSNEILEKIVQHEDSKLTVDSLARLENLPTEESLRNLEKNSKFKRSTKQNQPKLERKAKKMDIKRQMILLNNSKFIEKESLSPEKCESPVKRSLRLRRSQLIPQQFLCEMQEIDEQQAIQRYKKFMSNGGYILALMLQLILILKLMTPSSRV